MNSTQLPGSGLGSTPGEIAPQIDATTGYISNIDVIRQTEYPMLGDTTYLDHAGTTLYAKSLMETFSRDMISSLYGNPHSASASSQLSTRLIDDTRLRVLRFFNASPDNFDLVFVANATAAIKLVADAFRDSNGGFRYWYHSDAHTSLTGVRELATHGTGCFRDDDEVESWISNMTAGTMGDEKQETPELFAYPGQSNMTGHRPPQDWCRRVRSTATSANRRIYTLYDAAGLVSTCPLDLSDDPSAPDFTALSFYKIFGFPDLGALIVRKDSGNILRGRKFFGGGTVDMVMTLGEQWHAKKESSLHSRLEDGTVPFHSILALNSALSIHTRLYGSMANVSRHTSFLAGKAYDALSRLRHQNGAKACELYGVERLCSGVWSDRGPVLAFNLLDAQGRWVGKSEVEKLASIQKIQLRTGGLCNPGGIARHLDLSTEEMRSNFEAGQRCGDENDVINGKPSGAIRISLGAMSSLSDVEKFITFIQEFYIEKHIKSVEAQALAPLLHHTTLHQGFFVESLSIYPIKSCAAYRIPPDIRWEVKEAGLAFDREWCLIHQGTGAALSQKRYPRMALLRPFVDIESKSLRISFLSDNGASKALTISLEENGDNNNCVNLCDTISGRTSSVCGDNVVVQIYDSPAVAEFFTDALGVPCTLARCPSNSPSNRVGRPRRPRGHDNSPAAGKSILLSNESPILLISRSSVNRLNECIKASSPSSRGPSIGRAVPADSFRGNIVVAEDPLSGTGYNEESPYIEETWQSLRIQRNDGHDHGIVEDIAFEVMGPCQRCQMVCVDQKSAQKRQEPFSTLAKTRRKDGKVWFGMHLCLAVEGGECVGVEAEQKQLVNRGDGEKGEGEGKRRRPPHWIKVGDRVFPT